jgi:hypothetical protein
MARRLFLVLLAPALSACYTVASLETAVPPGQEVFEPRLVGTWELRSDTSVSSRMVITRESATQYLIRDQEAQGPSGVYMGRLGPLGPRRWILELSPVGDTSRYVHPMSSKDSTRLNPPDLPLMLPVHMPLVIERADSGLVFAVIRGDSLGAALRSGRLRTPFAILRSGDISATVVLTEEDPQRLNAALQQFVQQPGVLQPLPRVGQRLSLPSM